MSEAYIYQTVHTLAGSIWRLREHIAVMDTASQALFRRPFRPAANTLTRQIQTLLAAENSPSDRSVFVRMLLFPSGSLRLEYGGLSLYRGYDLRSLTPEAVTLCYDLPLGDYPTSAREAADALAQAQAAARGYRSVVRCDREDCLRTAGDAPLFAVIGPTVLTPPAPASVEASLAAEAVAAAGLRLETRPLQRGELSRFDELFYFDHWGVTAFARCDDTPYMDLTAARVAHAAARLSAESRKM